MAAPTKQKRGGRQALNSSNQRVSVQPTLLLDPLRQGDGHLDAYELYRQSREKHPGISLSTIHRNLQLLQRHFRKPKKTADAMKSYGEASYEEMGHSNRSDVPDFLSANWMCAARSTS
jgi:hypothetical protein